MFESFFSPRDEQVTAPRKQRAHLRRAVDHCASVIKGKTYPVENWSQGGLLIFTDSRLFAVGKKVDVTMKFRLRDSVVDVPHEAKVIRKGYDKVALQFLPLTDHIRKKFQSVIDDFMAAEFVRSQLS